MNAAMKLGLSSALLLITGGLLAYAPTASAQVGPLKNSGNGRCLTATATGAAITQPCNGSSIQAWAQTNTGSGFLLRNVATGRCLSSSSGSSSVITATCNAGVASQRWLRLNISATTTRYRSAATGLFLEGTFSSPVITSAPSSNPLQIWAY